MNIHKSQLFWCEQKGDRVLTHPQIAILMHGKRWKMMIHQVIPGAAIFEIYLRSEPVAAVAGAWCLHAVRLGAAVSICQWWSKSDTCCRPRPAIDFHHLDNPCFRSPWNLCRLQALGNEDSTIRTIRVCWVLPRLWDDFSNLNWMGRFPWMICVTEDYFIHARFIYPGLPA